MSEYPNQSSEQTVSLNATQRINVSMPEKTQALSGTLCPVCKAANLPCEVYCDDCGFLLAQLVDTDVSVQSVPPIGKLVVPDGSREFPLKDGVNTVGRMDADVVISDQTISRLHAKITVADGVCSLEDVGSTNGTWVDTRKIEPGESVVLADGCRLRFGSFVVDFIAPMLSFALVEDADKTASVLAEDSKNVLEPHDETADESTGTDVVVVEPAEEKYFGVLRAHNGAAYRISGECVRIGRRPEVNDLAVSDPYCSGTHARLDATEAGLVLTDLGSSNGTFINGIRLEANIERDLQIGDEVVFGQSVFTLERA